MNKNNVDWKGLNKFDFANELSDYKRLENKAFGKNENRRKRYYYNYLLIDLRRLKIINLTTSKKCWINFCDAIFYVGKGKYREGSGARILDHFLNATSSMTMMLHNVWGTWHNKKGKKTTDGSVVILPLFASKPEDEALTREAVMIEAFGDNSKLINQKSGSLAGEVGTWEKDKRQLLGKYLLYQAMIEFAHYRGVVINLDHLTHNNANNQVVAENKKWLDDKIDERLNTEAFFNPKKIESDSSLVRKMCEVVEDYSSGYIYTDSETDSETDDDDGTVASTSCGLRGSKTPRSALKTSRPKTVLAASKRRGSSTRGRTPTQGHANKLSSRGKTTVLRTKSTAVQKLYLK